jgi:hypothetical protein
LTTFVGAALTTASLLIGWILILLVVAVVLSGAIRLLPVGSRRAALVGIVPLISAAERATTAVRPLFMVALAVWAGLTYTGGGRIALPVPGSAAQQLGLALFIMAFTAFAGVFIPRAYGISLLTSFATMDRRFAGPVAGIWFFGGIFAGWLGTKFTGPFGAFPVAVALIYSGAVVRVALGAVAWKRFSEAPRAVARTAHPSGESLFIQLSDIHVTSHRSGVPTGGGKSGLDRLRKIATAICDGSLSTTMVLVSGDIADRGDGDEWKLAMEPLRQIRDHGVGVILAPGNHDLLFSYSPKRALWAMLKPPAFPDQLADAKQVERYFDAVLALQGTGITTWDGTSLAQYVDRVKGPWHKVRALWDTMRDTATKALGVSGKTRHAIAMSKLRKDQAALAEELVSRFDAEASLLIKPPRDGYWRDLVFSMTPDDWSDLNEHNEWSSRWYEPYPLRFALPNSVEVIVANSNPANPALLQSSLGASGAEQLQRLEKLLAESKAQTIIVMHHHAVARWEGDEYAFLRWGTLAHDLTESKQLWESLMKTARPGRQIFLLSGHVHERTRVAFVPAADGGGGLWYLESAALGEDGGKRVLTGVVTEAGVVEGAVTDLS